MIPRECAERAGNDRGLMTLGEDHGTMRDPRRVDRGPEDLLASAAALLAVGTFIPNSECR